MKRSGLKRPEYTKPERPPLNLNQPKASSTMSRRCDKVVTVEKFDYVRSPALMRAYQRLHCQRCGSTHDTFGAHSNWAEHGKGRGVKASDIFCASLCWVCHSDLDQGNFWDNEQKRAIWQAAHLKTMDALIALSWEPGEHKLRALLQKVGIVKA